MSHLTLSPRRLRAGALLTAAALLGAVAVVAAPTALAVEDVATSRLAGQDRFETAAEIALARNPDGAASVAIASGRAFPDALAGAALRMPVLLTEPGSLPDVTSDALEELGADTAIILGGTAAVSTAVENELEGMGMETTRLAGQNRYETAGAIAEAIGPDDVGALDDLPTAIVATGRDFADALAGGPGAATGDGSGVFPILLTDAGVPDATEDAIEALGIEQVVILGGTGAVPTSVETELEELTGNDARRLAGTNRFGTAVAVAEALMSDLGFAGEEVLLANGFVFADALAGGPLGAVREAPILLTPTSPLPEESEAFLVEHSDVIEQITVLGGTAAVAPSTEGEAETAAETPPAARANETITVTPTENASQANGTVREYTATGVDGPVDIALVDCAQVNLASDGSTVFTNSNGNLIADGTADDPDDAADEADTTSYISEVDGTPSPSDPDHNVINDDYADDVDPDDAGAVTFVVSGPSSSSTAASCITPVVFYDANSDDALNVASNGAIVPSEGFGTGGDTTFSPAEATAGAVFNVNVSNNPDELDRFSGCSIVTQAPTEVSDPDACSSFFYDSGDTFQLNGAGTTMQTFETRLSTGDDVRGTYKPGAVSTFNLYSDESPAAPSPLPSELQGEQEGDEVTVSYQESTTTTVDRYHLYRLVKSAADCPAYSDDYDFVGQEADENLGGSSIEPQTIVDSNPAPDTTYCYVLFSDDDGDTSVPSSAVEITSGEGSGVVPGAPRITVAEGKSDDNAVGADDLHELRFNEAMDPSTADGSYTVTGSQVVPSEFTIDCGTNAICVLDETARVLRVTITDDPDLIAPQYDLTISEVSGMTDTTDTPVDLAASTDKTIEDNSLDSGDLVRPFIDAACLSTDTGGVSGDQNFGSNGDVMELTMSEVVSRHVDDPDDVSEAELQAILGRDDIDMGDAVVALSGTGANVILTITSGSFASGVDSEGNILRPMSDKVVDGSTNSYLRDGADNPQQANPDDDPELQDTCS